MSYPPKIAEWLLRRLSPADERDCVAGDLAEEYRDLRVPKLGKARARLWYWGQTLRCLAYRATSFRTARSTDATAPAARRSGDGFMKNFLHDVRYGARTLLQTPTFTTLTVVTLALAIGVNTAIFSMVNLLMFRPLPIKDGETMGFIYSANPERGIQTAYASPADFLDFRENLASFEELAGVTRGRGFVMTGVDEPVRIVGFEATANTFDVWRLPPVLGRNFQPGEDQPGAERVVLLSHGIWERRFGSDPEALGRSIKLDGFETTIIGVVSPEIEFGGLAVAEIWTPLYLDRATTSRDDHNVWTSGRLRAGVTVEQADQEVAALAAGLAERYPETNSGWRYTATDLNGALATDDVWMIFYMLMLTVAFVLLIACSNIATMMLARATSRTKEIAVRAALGAGRGRILGQLLTESLLLSATAGLLGLVVARYFLAGLVWMAGDNPGTNFFEMMTIDRNVLFFTGAVALLAPVLFGFFPALRASRTDLSETLKDSTRGSSGAAGLRGRRVLVATQVSLALMLMVVAGLLIRTMVDQRTFQLGFETDGVLTMRIDLPNGKYPEEHQWLPFFDEVMERIRAVPNIGDVAWVSARPLADGAPSRNFLIEGEAVPEPESLPWAVTTVGSPEVLDLLQVPLVRGRGVDRRDNENTEPVVVVNEDAVERWFQGEDPLNRRIRLGGIDSTEPWLLVVGVAGNVSTFDPDNPTFPAIYLPMRQNPRQGMGLIARPMGDPLAPVAAVRQQVWEVDPDQPIGDIRTLSQIFSDNLGTFDAIISIFIVFAVFALVMASTGIYGVISFSVSQRTQEIGIRMALGAESKSVMRMITRQAMWLVAIGVFVGAAGAVVLARILAGAVAGLSPTDPLALGGVALALALAALIATLLPARRAVRIDPVIALRQE